MLFDEPSALEAYIMKTKDKSVKTLSISVGVRVFSYFSTTTKKAGTDGKIKMKKKIANNVEKKTHVFTINH